MYGWVKTNVRLGDYLYPRPGAKINIFDIVYVLIAKSECKAVSNSQNECAAGAFFNLNPRGLKSICLPLCIYVLIAKSQCKAVSKRMCGWGFL